MIPSEKQMLRARMLETLRTMSAADRATKSATIAGHLSALRGLVLGFSPLRSEPAWFAPGGKYEVALPRIEGDRIVFYPIASWDRLIRGAFGIREPSADETMIVAPERADIVLVPGLAFDGAGARLGRGGGFYDRFLAERTLRARRIGVAFAAQVVGCVPIEPHDARVDEIVTEDGWIEARSNGRDPG